MKKHYYARKLGRVAPEEEEEMAVVRRLVAPGDIAVDIGANYGVYTRFLSGLVGKEGKVYSIEAVPCTCDILEYGCRKLGMRNVRILRCAASDRDGWVTMAVPRLDSGGENYYRAQVRTPDGIKDGRQLRVRASTLDSLFSAGADRLSFIKCDTEGHELNCVLGGLKTIRRYGPALMIELGYDPEKIPSEQKLLDLLAGEGYGLYKLRRGILVKDYLGREEGINYFFLRESHLLRYNRPL